MRSCKSLSLTAMVLSLVLALGACSDTEPKEFHTTFECQLEDGPSFEHGPKNEAVFYVDSLITMRANGKVHATIDPSEIKRMNEVEAKMSPGKWACDVTTMADGRVIAEYEQVVTID